MYKKNPRNETTGEISCGLKTYTALIVGISNKFANVLVKQF